MATRFLLAVLLCLIGPGAALAQGKAALRDRCLKAIADSGKSAEGATFSENATSIGESAFLFQFASANGNFFCQVCDDSNPKIDCGSMGLILNYRGQDGKTQQLPAELEKKCLFYLQKEAGGRGGVFSIRHDLVERTKVTPAHTDARWVYNMALDQEQYRCVVRKSDGTFRVEQQDGADWRALAAGILY